MEGNKIQEQAMELEILKKKLSSYRAEGARVTKIPDDLTMELLTGWE